MNDAAANIAENLSRMEDAIGTACLAAGRSREDVRLMAVSKTHPVELLLEAIAAGHRLFGENRVQEFGEKAAVLAGSPYRVARGTEADQADSVAVHLIGHLQSNKSARAAELFTGVDTVDSLKLAERLFAAAKREARTLPVLVEIKLSDEEAKEGLAPGGAELAALLERLPEFAEHLPLRGLMTVAPISDDPEVARRCFRRLRVLREELAQRHPRLAFAELSMGMSGDFEAAIAEGSTMIRVGTAIFGARPKRV
ncbi:YggS family pyridoxal phosphate-dependent enzyme [Acidipila sp. EB88]|uniref:YggS family pyridoxal phosphate-dependent enzyme n=1 Tax=Acidipila sp. EB88 TaxID=2305226 RepID=UPI000F5DBD56|nr:YggS family pyridoxal phosphate-dependent enzyme [Acidipila sp. EB88]RRA47744.1 YggS family pyridoxal phosphate-dependent enzyme [Acidipila sp. EB88]